MQQKTAFASFLSPNDFLSVPCHLFYSSSVCLKLKLPNFEAILNKVSKNENLSFWKINIYSIQCGAICVELVGRFRCGKLC